MGVDGILPYLFLTDADLDSRRPVHPTTWPWYDVLYALCKIAYKSIVLFDVHSLGATGQQGPKKKQNNDFNNNLKIWCRKKPSKFKSPNFLCSGNIFLKVFKSSRILY